MLYSLPIQSRWSTWITSVTDAETARSSCGTKRHLTTDRMVRSSICLHPAARSATLTGDLEVLSEELGGTTGSLESTEHVATAAKKPKECTPATRPYGHD